MKKANVLLNTLVAGCLLSVATAQASVIVSYGGKNTNVAGGDQSGLTSNFVPVSNTNLPAGFFIETFDAATKMTGFGDGSTAFNITGKSSGCAVNTLASNSGVTVTTSADKALGVQKGSTSGVAAAPAGDSTCFAFTPAPGYKTPTGLAIPNGRNLTSFVTIDYSGLLNTFKGLSFNYLGFYWGSVDDYNKIDFFDLKGDLLATISGTELLKANNGSTGNQIAKGSNVYVNLFLGDKSFSKFTFTTYGVASEFDNIVVGKVSAPVSLGLLGLGLIGLAWRRRVRKA